MYSFVPRRPVKSFQDLEVYQKLLAVSVAVAKRIPTHNVPLPTIPLPILPEVDSKSLPTIASKLIQTALDLPLKIATAHSLRFSDQLKAIATLEDVMLGCNLLIVYLEQYRDIYNVPVPKLTEVANESQRDSSQKGSSNEIGTGTIESEFFEEQIRTLLTTRFKVMHLQMSWKKFMKETP